MHLKFLNANTEERGTRGGAEAEEVTLIYAPWCTLIGGLVFTILLFTWRSQRWVFFDQICIHQYDARLKMSGIVSIGSFLRYSKTLLLVWDETPRSAPAWPGACSN